MFEISKLATYGGFRAYSCRANWPLWPVKPVWHVSEAGNCENRENREKGQKSPVESPNNARTHVSPITHQQNGPHVAANEAMNIQAATIKTIPEALLF